MKDGHDRAVLIGHAQCGQQVDAGCTKFGNAMPGARHGESYEAAERCRWRLAQHQKLRIFLQVPHCTEGSLRMMQHPNEVIREAIKSVKSKFEDHVPSPLNQTGRIPRTRETGEELHRIGQEVGSQNRNGRGNWKPSMDGHNFSQEQSRLLVKSCTEERSFGTFLQRPVQTS